MAHIHFFVDDLDYVKFKQEVGEGNVSSILRNFVISYINKYNEKDLEIEKKFKSTQKEYLRLKAKLDLIKLQKEKEEKKEKEFMEEQKKRFRKAEGRAMKDHVERFV